MHRGWTCCGYRLSVYGMTIQPTPIRPSADLSQVVAAEVRALMGRHRVNQEQLARVLNVSQGQVSARLRGRTAFTLDDLRRLAEFFGTTPGALLGDGTIAPLPPGPPEAPPKRDGLADLTARKRGRATGRGSTREYLSAA